MRAKLLVSAVALTNLLLGLSLGIVVAGRAANDAPASRQPAPPSPRPSATPGERGPRERASIGPVESGRPHRGRRGRRKPHDPEGMVRHLQAQVGLDEAQVTQAREILTASQAEVMQLLGSVRPRLHEIHTETQAKLRAIMTPAQQEKLDALRAEMERRGPPWRWKGRRGERGERGHRSGRRGFGGPGGHGPEGRGPKGRGPEGRGPEGRGPEGRGPEGRGPEGPEGQRHEEGPR